MLTPLLAPTLALQAAVKVGDSLLDNADYFRALPTQDGKQVALSNFKGARRFLRCAARRAAA